MKVLFALMTYVGFALAFVKRVLKAIGGDYLASWPDYCFSLAASFLRMFAGSVAVPGLAKAGRHNEPIRPLVLYAYNGCPFCCKVYETASALGLDVEVRPTPRLTLTRYGVIDGSRFRPEAVELGGKAMFPLLQDPNNVGEDGQPAALYDSADVVEYLMERYGPQLSEKEAAPSLWSFAPCSLGLGITATPWYIAHVGAGWNTMLMFFSRICRPLVEHGVLRIPSTRPGQALELYSVEGAADARMVHERLCSLEIPYLWHATPAGLPDRLAAFKEQCGASARMPFLLDPNSQQRVQGASAILKHLNGLYQTGEAPNENFLSSYSTKGASAEHGTIGPKQSKAD